MKKEISTEKLTKEINDTLIHKAFVVRSGNYLAAYLTKHNRSVDAIRLMKRCHDHDASKLRNTEEFMYLASIVDEIDSMHDVEHVLSTKQQEAIKLHWKRNSHHPEHYDSPNDMSDLDLLEMACDCHARSKQYKTNLIEYIDAQQEIRFHFDREHFEKLRNYCLILVELTKKDNYSVVGEMIIPTAISFDIKDSTLKKLENFDETCYVDCIKTDRLYMEKKDVADFASVDYTIYLRDENVPIGYISLKFNAHIEYKIYESYAGLDYAIEALAKFIEVSSFNELFVIVRRDNKSMLGELAALDFEITNETDCTYTCRFRKKENKRVLGEEEHCKIGLSLIKTQ